MFDTIFAVIINHIISYHQFITIFYGAIPPVLIMYNTKTNGFLSAL